ncbi:MAG: TonB-dependent receptor [Gammaproteobacteria bacterium]|nr:TonB-dependent receptor [Gammaproteobacteria bacterium]MDH5320950.1 TonB-dependent receptor [Gammaproteobacteria bacterium]
MKNTPFYKTPLATGIALALGAAAVSPAQAQDQGVEEVVVTGYRGSLEAALDLKRESTGVMDAISATDIGKFPDTNLAESLQRITGVSVNRVEGEGSEVTIRGFGGQFNLVTLNGRQLPAADNAANFFGLNANAGGGNSRSFDFSNIASEGVSGLQVYKSGRASAPSGGIGGTINVQTHRPLDFGTNYSVQAKAVDDAGGDGTTPEFSGLASWVNDDNTIGVTAFASYQERDYSNRTALGGGFFVWQTPFNSSIPAFSNATIVNEPGPDQLAGFIPNASMTYSEGQRERTNASLTAQFAPSDRMTLTLDAMWARNDQEQKAVGDLPFYVRQFDFAYFDGNPVFTVPTLLGEPLVSGGGSDFTQAGKELPFRNSLFFLRDELEQFGANLDYKLNDSWTMNVDVYTATGTAGGNGPGGEIYDAISIGGQAVAMQWMDFTNEISQSVQAIADGSGPTSTMVGGQLVNFAGGNANGIFEKSDLGSQWILRDFREQESTMDQVQLKFSWDNDSSIRANFGLGYYDNEIIQLNTAQREELGGWNTGFIGDIVTLMGEDAIEEICISCQFNDHDNLIKSEAELIANYTAAGGILAPGASFRVVGENAFFINPIAFAEAFDGFTSGGGVVYDANNRKTTSTNDRTINESAVSAYAEFILDSEVDDMPLQVVVGLRYEQTDVESSSVQSIPIAKDWTSDNDFNTRFGARSAVKQVHDYDYVLPNVDFSLEVTDNIKVRASMSQSIARPELGSMFVDTNAGNPGTATYLGGQWTGSSGNAQLDPLESTNLDLSFEYYYGEGSAFTVAYFDKSISNFVGIEQVRRNLFGLTDVASGLPGTLSGDAVAALLAHVRADGSTGSAVTETNMFTMTAILANPQDFPGGAAEFIDPLDPGGAAQSSNVATAYDIPPQPGDPLAIFLVQQPTNAENANIDGFEVALVHFFEGALDGFGINANATFVNGDVKYDISLPQSQDQFALTGLSDSYNFIAFWENDTWSARILYNNRGEFLSNTNWSDRIPRFVDEYEQIDFNVSWRATDNLVFTLEGINMTEEPIVFRGRSENQVQAYIETDRRLMLGARYVF